MNRQTRLLGSFVLLVSLCITSCKHSQGAGSQIKSNMTANLEDVLWTNPSRIPICWEPVTKNQARSMNNYEGPSVEEINDFKGKVRKNVESEFAKAGIGFSGWQACTDGSPGMRVLLGGESAQVRDFGRRLDGLYAGVIINDPKAAGEYALQTALHEIGHALGLRHEASRAEALEKCEDYYIEGGEPSTFSIGPYDPDSLMNYCVYDQGDPNNEDALARLSPGDIDALKNIYRGTVAELEEPLPYIIGVANVQSYVKNVERYRYKYGPEASTSCQTEEGYSAPAPASTGLQLKELPNGTIRICLLGENEGLWQDRSAATEYLARIAKNEVFAGYRADRSGFVSDPIELSLDPKYTQGDIKSLQVKLGPAADDPEVSETKVDCLADEGYQSMDFKPQLHISLTKSKQNLQKICIRALANERKAKSKATANEIIVFVNRVEDFELFFLPLKTEFQDGKPIETSYDAELTLIVRATNNLDEEFQWSFGSGDHCSDEWSKQKLKSAIRLDQAALPQGKVTFCAKFPAQSSAGKVPLFQKSWAWSKSVRP